MENETFVKGLALRKSWGFETRELFEFFQEKNPSVTSITSQLVHFNQFADLAYIASFVDEEEFSDATMRFTQCFITNYEVEFEARSRMTHITVQHSEGIGFYEPSIIYNLVLATQAIYN